MIFRAYRGLKQDLPKELEANRLACTVDTKEIFVGQGEGKPLKQLVNTEDVAELLTSGFVFYAT